MKKALAAFICIALATGCHGALSSRPLPYSAALVQDGRFIAETQCSGCHAVHPGEASKRPDAPRFPVLFQHYRADVLDEEFIQGVKVGHPDMPNFQFRADGADALVAYIRSIQEPARD